MDPGAQVAFGGDIDAERAIWLTVESADGATHVANLLQVEHFRYGGREPIVGGITTIGTGFFVARRNL